MSRQISETQLPQENGFIEDKTLGAAVVPTIEILLNLPTGMDLETRRGLERTLHGLRESLDAIEKYHDAIYEKTQGVVDLIKQAGRLVEQVLVEHAVDVDSGDE